MGTLSADTKFYAWSRPNIQSQSTWAQGKRDVDRPIVFCNETHDKREVENCVYLIQFHSETGALQIFVHFSILEGVL